MSLRSECICFKVVIFFFKFLRVFLCVIVFILFSLIYYLFLIKCAGGHYCFAVDTSFVKSDQPIMDDPNLENYNIDQVADQFVADLQLRSASFATDQLLVQWGCDFAFANAFIMFKNMDKLINYINNHTEYGMCTRVCVCVRFCMCVHASVCL